MRRIRTRPIPRPSSSAATAIMALGSVWRPCTPGSSPPTNASSTSTQPCSRSRPGTYHGVAQFMQHGPGRLVALQAQHALQPHGAHPILLAGHPPRCPKPQGQRQTAVLKHRPGSHRYLIVAAGAANKTIPLRPALRPATTRAPETIRPTKSTKILPARRFGRKAPLQLPQIRFAFGSQPNFFC